MSKTGMLKRIPKKFFWYLLFLITVIIIIFNDAFGSSEPFALFSFFHFLLLLFLLIRWLFKQIKLILSLKNEKTKTELLHLKSQVSPHFFFNILNNLYGLVDKDSKKAKALILKLSDMMRYSIYDGQKETVLLSEEISYLQTYIELHKMRYRKTIDIEFNYDIEGNDYEIMPLLFIILLENSFKHGVENLRDNAYVYINMKAEKNQVYFDIENNFDETIVSDEKSGIGLHNLKRRLELVYPKTHTLSFFKVNNVYKSQLNISKL
ncbi:histidine kinase [uncultured Tenacibaculum sp.]|uniref:sensor histidine kinase n=1 Tax=uncultured Tenacibaculum sp. TaxID=174713 RepID=UPI00262AFC3E|nr:histidine kinase [uncultured Tenacibaculum sp.]